MMRQQMMRNLSEMKSFIDGLCSKGEENWVKITIDNAHESIGRTIKFNTRSGSILAVVTAASDSGKTIYTDYAKNPTLVVEPRKLYMNVPLNEIKVVKKVVKKAVESIVGKSGLIKGNSVVMLKEWRDWCSDKSNWENEIFIYPSKLDVENKQLANFRNNVLVGGHKWNDKVNYEANKAEMLSILGQVAHGLLFKKNKVRRRKVELDSSDDELEELEVELEELEVELEELEENTVFCHSLLPVHMNFSIDKIGRIWDSNNEFVGTYYNEYNALNIVDWVAKRMGIKLIVKDIQNGAKDRKKRMSIRKKGRASFKKLLKKTRSSLKMDWKRKREVAKEQKKCHMSFKKALKKTRSSLKMDWKRKGEVVKERLRRAEFDTRYGNC
jgi:hypothetical protein